MLVGTVLLLHKDYANGDMKEYELHLNEYKRVRPALLDDIPERVRSLQEIQPFVKKLYVSSKLIQNEKIALERMMLAVSVPADAVEIQARRCRSAKKSPFKHNLVSVHDPDQPKPVWMNASDVRMKNGTVFRVSEVPMDGSDKEKDNTMCDFWMMVQQGRTRYVVQVCQMADERYDFVCPQYFPDAVGETVNCGRILLKTIKRRTILNGDVIERELEITSKSGKSVVTHFFFVCWLDKIPNGKFETVFAVLNRVNKSPWPVLVVCENGIDKSMVFTAVEYITRYAQCNPTTALGNIFVELYKQRHGCISRIDSYYAWTGAHYMLRKIYGMDMEDFEKALTDFKFHTGNTFMAFDKERLHARSMRRTNVKWNAKVEKHKARQKKLDVVEEKRAGAGTDSKATKGAKRQYVRELETQAGPRMQHLIDALKLVPYESKAMSTAKAYRAENVKRSAWIETMQLPKNESSFLLYLVERGKKIGSSAMSKISAAYQMKRRLEIPMKKKPVEVTLEDIEKITQRAMQSNRPASDRDALLAILSFRVMLRASEAAEIKWDGVTQAGDLIEVVVEKAKNDQMALGRRSFFNYEPGSDADILMCRWRLRCKERACEYVFSNLEGSKKADEAIDLGPGFEDAQGDREVGSDAPRIQESRSELLASAGTFDGRDQDVPEAQGCRRAVKGVGGDADESESDEE
ncbi:unnamed protein product [Caenorhabditis sp. 36 PRJEB53466]|nr:unnamed protein product [Caenorhabditis sp. 36 PRJEB53466]